MSLFGLGVPELAVIGVVVALIFGPKNLAGNLRLVFAAALPMCSVLMWCSCVAQYEQGHYCDGLCARLVRGVPLFLCLM